MDGKGLGSDLTTHSIHRSVMVNEVINGLNIDPAGTYIDGTFGAGGHTKAILNQLGQQGKVHAFDADNTCQQTAKKINDARLKFHHANYATMCEFVKPAVAAGVLLDLGLSMDQLNDPSRGFSFMHEGPLDMRFDQHQRPSLVEKINKASEKTIGKILNEYGQERSWRKIAKVIHERKKGKKLTTTEDLVAACFVGRSKTKRQKIHPATRVFQALRIWVNDELNCLIAGLNAATTLLRPGGRLVVISFHSLEDRIVKQFMKSSNDEQTPVTQLGKLLRPSEDEVSANRAARSARLRIGVKQ